MGKNSSVKPYIEALDLILADLSKGEVRSEIFHYRKRGRNKRITVVKQALTDVDDILRSRTEDDSKSVIDTYRFCKGIVGKSSRIINALKEGNYNGKRFERQWGNNRQIPHEKDLEHCEHLLNAMLPYAQCEYGEWLATLDSSIEGAIKAQQKASDLDDLLDGSYEILDNWLNEYSDNNLNDVAEVIDAEPELSAILSEIEDIEEEILYAVMDVQKYSGLVEISLREHIDNQEEDVFLTKEEIDEYMEKLAEISDTIKPYEDILEDPLFENGVSLSTKENEDVLDALEAVEELDEIMEKRKGHVAYLNGVRIGISNGELVEVRESSHKTAYRDTKDSVAGCLEFLEDYPNLREYYEDLLSENKEEMVDMVSEVKGAYHLACVNLKGRAQTYVMTVVDNIQDLKELKLEINYLLNEMCALKAHRVPGRNDHKGILYNEPAFAEAEEFFEVLNRAGEKLVYGGADGKALGAKYAYFLRSVELAQQAYTSRHQHDFNELRDARRKLGDVQKLIRLFSTPVDERIAPLFENVQTYVEIDQARVMQLEQYERQAESVRARHR